jgi:hypothetical protein
LSTTLVKFEESHGTFDKKIKKKTPLLPMEVINRFERSCGTFKGGKGRNPLSSVTLGKFVRGKMK